VIFGSLASMETSYFISIRCRSLPPDDQELVRWFEELDGVQDVSTSRNENTVNVEFTKRHGSFELVTPPLPELGYTGLQGMKSTITNYSLMGGFLNWISKIPVMVWFTVATVFAALLARRIILWRVAPMSGIQPDAEKDT
jgi:hypothetical protein